LRSTAARQSGRRPGGILTAPEHFQHPTRLAPASEGALIYPLEQKIEQFVVGEVQEVIEACNRGLIERTAMGRKKTLENQIILKKASAGSPAQSPEPGIIQPPGLPACCALIDGMHGLHD